MINPMMDRPPSAEDREFYLSSVFDSVDSKDHDKLRTRASILLNESYSDIKKLVDKETVKKAYDALNKLATGDESEKLKAMAEGARIASERLGMKG